MQSPSKIQAVALAIRFEATRELLALIVARGSDREAGRKALLIAYVIAPDLIGSQKELARRMAVSEGRVSQMLKAIRANLCGKMPSR